MSEVLIVRDVAIVRDLPEPRTLVETVEHLLNTLGLRERAQQQQNQQQEAT